MSQSALTRLWCLAAPLLLALPIASAEAAVPAKMRGIDVAKTWTTGDVNGDGTLDLMGRPSDRLGVTFGPGDVRSAPSGPGLEVAAASGETLGEVSDSGDFDGDGKDDLLVTARRGTQTSGTDLVYVIHGATAAGTVVASAGTRVTAISLGTRFSFGGEPQFVGDVNGDGKNDVAVSRSTQPDISTTGWVGGGTLVFGGTPGPTINANAASSRTIVINTVRSCSFIFTSYLCGASSLRIDPVGDVNRDGRADVYVDGAGPDRRWVLLGRTSTGTVNAGALPPQAVRTPAFDTLGTFPEPAGDVNDDGFADFTVAAKVTDATTTPQRRIVILGSAQTSGTYTAGPSLTSAGEVGVAKLIDDQTGDGRRDLIVLTKTPDDDEPNWDDPDTWDQTFETSLARIYARIVSIPPGATGTIDLDSAPTIKGLPEAGYSRSADSILSLRVGNIDADARQEVGFYDGGRLVLVDVGRDRLASELTDLPSLGLKGITLPNGAVSRTTGVPRTLRLREPSAVLLEYLRPDGSLAAKESRAFGAGTTRDRWFGTVGKTQLPNGTYTLRATPRDGLSNWGKPQTQQVVIADDNQTESTVVLEPRYSDASGALLAGSGSYRLECTEGDWVSAINGVPSPLLTENPLKAGTRCTLRLGFFSGNPVPGECDAYPSNVTVNGQQVGDQLPVTFTLQPGVNRVVQTVGCTAPVFQPDRVVPPMSSEEDWWGVANLSSGPAILTWTANQTGYRVYRWPIDPNGRTFEFTLTMANGNGAAEGMALSFLEPKAGAFYGGMPGTGGGALGVGGLNGTIIGFDQFKGPGDTAGNTVGIANGASTTGLSWLQTADAGTRMRGAGAVPVKVVSDGTKVSIYVNGSLRVQRTMRLPSPAYLAVSATTSSTWQQQTLGDLRITPTPAE